MRISVCKDFTQFPGARSRKHGPFSGEEFRETLLSPHFRDGSEAEIVVDLDGVDGYATSFLEEAFGGLVREFGFDVVRRRLRIVSTDDPALAEAIERYMVDASE